MIAWDRLIAGLMCVVLTANVQAAEPARILFDTDISTDCDDAGAMAVLHALADNGECTILATGVSTKNPWGAPCVAAINRYYGRPDLPIGVPKGSAPAHDSKFARRIAEEFPQSLPPADQLPDVGQLYRTILASQPDGSVILVTVGYLTNVRTLLNLPATDERSGMDIVRSKVKLWVCMGGNFIGAPPKDDLKLGNVNFTRDAPAAFEAIRDWPGAIVFVGREVASVPSGLAIGRSLEKTPENNPVRKAYFYYHNGVKNRHVADLAAVLYAVRGPSDYWHLSDPGSLDLHPDMTFAWKAEPSGRQRYLIKRTIDGKLNDRFVEKVLDDLLIQPPRTVEHRK